MSHPLFGPEIRLMLQDDDTASIASFCESLHPATAAEALQDELEPTEVWRFLQHASIANQALIFEYLPIEKQVELVGGTGRPHVAKLIEQMSHDDRVDLLRRLNPQVVESLLRLVDEANRKDIATLVSYPENTAGALMTTDYAWLPEHITVDEALDRLRLQAPNSETIYYVYVLDEQRKLLGVVSLRDLILAPRTGQLLDIMSENLVTVRAGERREKVSQVLADYDLIAIPVVDDDARLIGIVTHDDVIDVMVAEATEDAHRMGAVGPLAENYLQASFTTVWRKRAFWLACLFIAQLGTFWAMSHFEEAMAKVVVLSLFVPLCLSTGGNSGAQSATLVIRSLALGQIEPGSWLRVLRNELVMGVALGLTLGFIGFFRAAATSQDERGGARTLSAPMLVHVPTDTELTTHEGSVLLPAGCLELQPSRIDRVVLPPAGSLTELGKDARYTHYELPAESLTHSRPVDRWRLGQVIAISVAGICLWGSLVGSMLPLVFRKFGFDPGVASSPFVATLVDVTGILIYFNIARLFLPELSG